MTKNLIKHHCFGVGSAKQRTRRHFHRSGDLEVLESRWVPAVNIAVADAAVWEGDLGETPALVFTVTRTGVTDSAVTVDYHTADGTGVAGTDYVPQSGSVTIPAGATSATLSVPIMGNGLLQGDRNFSLHLTNAVTDPPVDMANQVTFATGSAPISAAAGDLNGDGRLDLAVANYVSGSVSVFLNTSPVNAVAPTFAPAQTFVTGAFPYAVTMGDLNGDDVVDLAVANAGSDNVVVLWNTTPVGAATASFEAPVAFAVGDAPFALALGDVNGDGLLDIASANYRSGDVSVLMNATPINAVAPEFASAVNLVSGAHPTSLVMSDLNRDGSLDLAVANAGENRLAVFLNLTTPNAPTPLFAAAQKFGTGSNPYAVTVADLNGDGAPDLVTANAGELTLTVLTNTTAANDMLASFVAWPVLATTANPYAVAAGDLNGDGKTDLAAAADGSGNSLVYLNTTPENAVVPTFADARSFAAGSSPFSIVMADFNGDDRSDLAVANYGSNSMSVLLNTTELATIVQPVANGTITDDDTPVQLQTVVGDAQGTPAGCAFSAPLVVKVVNAQGHPVEGVGVTFTAPASGAGLGCGGITVLTDSAGLACSGPITANGVCGANYLVEAKLTDIPTLATSFRLTNQATVDAALTQVGVGIQTYSIANRVRLPWLGIRSVSLTFSAPVTLGVNDLHVTGTSGIDYAPSAVTAAGNTVTWILSQPVTTVEELSVQLTGAPVADYATTLKILPGDFTDDGYVKSGDLLKINMLRGALINATTMYADVNGDGVIDVNDVNLIRPRVGTRLL